MNFFQIFSKLLNTAFSVLQGFFKGNCKLWIWFEYIFPLKKGCQKCDISCQPRQKKFKNWGRFFIICIARHCIEELNFQYSWKSFLLIKILVKRKCEWNIEVFLKSCVRLKNRKRDRCAAIPKRKNSKLECRSKDF